MQMELIILRTGINVLVLHSYWHLTRLWYGAIYASSRDGQHC